LEASLGGSTTELHYNDPKLNFF